MEALRKAMISFTTHVPHLNFLISTTVLIIFVTIASFIDASVLFSAFIAGGLVNNFSSSAKPHAQDQTPPRENSPGMYESYYKPFMDSILVPFFFVSAIQTSTQTLHCFSDLA
jgi:Kef-type K+ transport system membrane component KefB